MRQSVLHLLWHGRSGVGRMSVTADVPLIHAEGEALLSKMQECFYTGLENLANQLVELGQILKQLRIQRLVHLFRQFQLRSHLQKKRGWNTHSRKYTITVQKSKWLVPILTDGSDSKSAMKIHSHSIFLSNFKSDFVQGNKIFEITADFRTRLWTGHCVYGKIMNVNLQTSTRFAEPSSKIKNKLFEDHSKIEQGTKSRNVFLNRKFPFLNCDLGINRCNNLMRMCFAKPAKFQKRLNSKSVFLPAPIQYMIFVRKDRIPFYKPVTICCVL